MAETFLNFSYQVCFLLPKAGWHAVFPELFDSGVLWFIPMKGVSVYVCGGGVWGEGDGSAGLLLLKDKLLLIVTTSGSSV